MTSSLEGFDTRTYYQFKANKNACNREKDDLNNFFAKISKTDSLDKRIQNLDMLTLSANNSKNWHERGSISEPQLNQTLIQSIKDILNGNLTIIDQNQEIQTIIQPIIDHLTDKIKSLKANINDYKTRFPDEV